MARLLSLQPPVPSRGRPLSGGPYELIELIGEGGCARVHKAADLGHPYEPAVAVKTPLPHPEKRARNERMLEREATVLARLNHPNIVRFIDHGYEDDTYMLVMEYVCGVSVGRLMRVLDERCTRIPRPIALSIALHVLDALEYVHSLSDETGTGLVHRDVSPSNLLVSHRGQIKLIDFGIARSLSNPKVTPGRLSGKIGYLSPEQARGEPVDQRSDLFSFAVVLSEMLLHCRFFPGADAFDTLRMILRADLGTLERARSRLPFELRIVLATALNGDPEGRFQSAAEMRGALVDYARHDGLELPDADVLASWLRANGTIQAASGTFEAPGGLQREVNHVAATV